MAAMSEGFAKLGFQSERRGSDLQAVGDLIGVDERQENKIVPQELSQDTLKMLKLFYNTSGCNEHFENALKNRGYSYHTFVEKYGSDWFEKI